jgi:hypothetical protein
VKDYFKLLLVAVLNGELFCETLILAKRPIESKANPLYYLATHLNDIYDCLEGVRYNKKLMRHAFISRYDFQEWCKNLSIDLPEFWFPPGWNYSFEMPEDGTRALWAQHVEPEEGGDYAVRFDLPEESPTNENQATNSDIEDKPLRANQKARLRAQQFALDIWKRYPERSIAVIVRSEEFLLLPDVSHYGESAHRKWISQVAPIGIKGKRGRPKSTK